MLNFATLSLFYCIVACDIFPFQISKPKQTKQRSLDEIKIFKCSHQGKNFHIYVKSGILFLTFSGFILLKPPNKFNLTSTVPSLWSVIYHMCIGMCIMYAFIHVYVCSTKYICKLLKKKKKWKPPNKWFEFGQPAPMLSGLQGEKKVFPYTQSRSLLFQFMPLVSLCATMRHCHLALAGQVLQPLSILMAIC